MGFLSKSSKIIMLPIKEIKVECKYDNLKEIIDKFIATKDKSGICNPFDFTLEINTIDIYDMLHDSECILLGVQTCSKKVNATEHRLHLKEAIKALGGKVVPKIKKALSNRIYDEMLEKAPIVRKFSHAIIDLDHSRILVSDPAAWNVIDRLAHEGLFSYDLEKRDEYINKFLESNFSVSMSKALTVEKIKELDVSVFFGSMAKGDKDGIQKSYKGYITNEVLAVSRITNCELLIQAFGYDMTVSCNNKTPYPVRLKFESENWNKWNDSSDVDCRPQAWAYYASKFDIAFKAFNHMLAKDTERSLEPVTAT